MFDEIADALNKTAKNEKISMMTLTGNGKFYSSGNDITNFLKIYGWLRKLWIYFVIKFDFSEENGVDHAVKTLDQFVFAFVEFPKPLKKIFKLIFYRIRRSLSYMKNVYFLFFLYFFIIYYLHNLWEYWWNEYEMFFFIFENICYLHDYYFGNK